MVVLTPDSGQLINMGIGRGFMFSVMSQKTAARYAVHRSKLQAPIVVDGPSNQQVRATEICTIAFPQEKAVGGMMIIYAYLVDTLEECYETPGDGLQRVADAAGRGRRGISAVATSCAAGRSPALRADPRRRDAGPGEGEPIHVEVPRVQGAANDGDGVAHRGTGLEHACVTDVGGRRSPTRAHGAAK